MTIATTTNRVVYVGNGATTVWTYGFLIPDASEVVVQLTNTTSGVVTTLNSAQYSITGIGNSGGGTLTYSPALAVGNTITIQRVLPVTQQTSLSNQGGFYPSVVEAALDYLTMVTQQLNDAVGRALVASPNGVATIDALNNRVINALAASGANDLVTLAQLQAQYSATGNVPLPTVGQVGQWLKATATNTFGWAALTLTASQISDSTAIGRAALTAANGATFADAGAAAEVSVTAAATTEVFVGVTSPNVVVPGNTGITAFSVGGTPGAMRIVRFTGTPIITQSGSIIVPWAQNIQIAAGDVLVLRLESTGVVRVLDYFPANGKSPINIGLGGSTAWRNLKVTNGGTPNTQVAVTADSIQATDGTTYYVSGAFSVTISTATTGANALDTGTIGASSWYSVWGIYNPTTNTWAGLISLSTTSPTLPSGYTHKVRLGWVRTDGSSVLLRTLQLGRRAQYVVTAATNTAALPTAGNGSSGSVTTPTWTQVSLSSVVPPTASRVQGVVVNPVPGAGNSVIMLAPNNGYGAYTSTTNPPPVGSQTAAGNGINSSVPFEFLLETLNLFYASSGASNSANILGWEDNI